MQDHRPVGAEGLNVRLPDWPKAAGAAPEKHRSCRRGAFELTDEPKPLTALHSEVLSRLRDHIIDGHLADGARIPERQLCELFGISRTPLREALKVLASEGVVELLPNRGARVRQLSARDIREMFDMMGGLEALAGRLACENITDEEVAAIEDKHHEMYGFYIRQDLPAYFECNQQIHRMILMAARNATLVPAHTGLSDRIRRLRFSANQARKRDRWGEAMREHEAMLDALRRRDGAELSDILFQHLRNKRDATIEHMLETGLVEEQQGAA
jgi:DNA-binding GntR family transcriptional regulator